MRTRGRFPRLATSSSSRLFAERLVGSLGHRRPFEGIRQQLRGAVVPDLAGARACHECGQVETAENPVRTSPAIGGFCRECLERRSSQNRVWMAAAGIAVLLLLPSAPAFAQAQQTIIAFQPYSTQAYHTGEFTESYLLVIDDQWVQSKPVTTALVDGVVTMDPTQFTPGGHVVILCPQNSATVGQNPSCSDPLYVTAIQAGTMPKVSTPWLVTPAQLGQPTRIPPTGNPTIPPVRLAPRPPAQLPPAPNIRSRP